MARYHHSSSRASNFRKENALWVSKGTRTELSFEQMQELLKRRLKFGDATTDQELKDAVDDFRMELEGLGDVDSDLIQEEDQRASAYLAKRIVPVIGSIPAERRPGTWRWVFGNVNNLATHKVRNFKAHQLKAIIEKYDVNGFAFCEIGLDTRCFKPSETVCSFLQLEGNTRLSMAHNKYKPKISLGQQGGCAVIARGEVCQYAKVTKGAGDFRNLGRWASMILSSHPDQRLRIVSAYNVGRPKPKGIKTVYQQILQHIQHEGLGCTPRKLMRMDFVDQIKTWLRQGDRILLYMDANENVLEGPLCSELAKLGFTPMAHQLHGKIPNTHVEGSDCIDEVWASPGVEVTGVQLLSFHQSVGDHRTFLVDFTTRSAVGLFAHLIVRPECRRLINSNKACTERYRELVEEQWNRHRISERLDRLEALDESYPVPDSNSKPLARLDTQIEEIAKYGEKNCRKIRKIDGEYSLPAKYWHEKMVAISALQRRLLNKTHNDGNICRTARRHEISHPRQLNRHQLDQLYKIAKARKRTIKQQASFLRKELLREIRAKAQLQKNISKVNDIDAILARERDTKMWKVINRVTKPPHPGALMRIERELDGEVVEFTEEEALVDNILEVIQDRFSGAEDANISNCSITDELGDFGFTELGMKIISGDFEAPEDVDLATKRILTAIGRIGREHKDDDFDISLSEEQYATSWSRARERTSSSMSKLHFGHYIAMAGSPLLSKGMAKKISLHARWGSPPDRWFNVLMVMLEKKLGVVLVPKLRAILLKEADNNFQDGYIFGHRMLQQARENGLIPEEQLAEKGKTSEDGVWAKVLKADYARLRREAFGQISADAANCYDFVNHLILALLLQALGVPIGPIVSMLLTIRFMRYYLRTGFGESKKYMGGTLAQRRMHGLNQGSKAAPALWTILSSLLVMIQRDEGFVAIVSSPISRLISIIAGLLYVDDTDLYVIEQIVLSNQELLERAQGSLDCWGNSLLGGGGGCKPVKCFAYLLNYDWDENGQWYCESLVDGYELTVPTREGDVPIELCHADDGRETLGVFTAPGGNSTAQLEKISNKVRTWYERVKQGRLPVHFVWTSYLHQLWMGVRYGIGALPADRDEVDGFLQDSDRQILPIAGVNRNIRTGWRTLHRSFLGIGLFNFEVEMMIQRINLFMQHYASPFDIGITLQATMELVQLEAGFRDCPLLHPFYPHGQAVTHCWFRSFWQAIDHFGFKLFIDYPEIPIPRERDHLLIELFDATRATNNISFTSWNRCRICCKALFLSDLVTADGRQIDPRFLSSTIMDDPPLSSYNFGRERPCPADWEEWKRFWSDFTLPGFVLRVSLGPWVHPSHRPNEWFYNHNADMLFRRRPGGGDYYGRVSGLMNRLRSQQHFQRIGAAPAVPDLTTYTPCVAIQVEEGLVNLGAMGPDRYEPPPIEHDLLSLLRSWGGEWMWEDFQVKGSLDTIVTSIREGRAIWCTDGSFDRLAMPNISSSGWVIFDPLTKNHIYGGFYEDTGPSAGSFRGELLGLTALHLIAAAIVELYGEVEAPNTMFCDNERALGRARWFRRRIPPGSKHGDLQRLLRNLRPTLLKMFKYEHIYGHADRERTWSQLSLVEKLNCFCDHLAKVARLKALNETRDQSTQRLPREKVLAVFLHSQKQTGDISDPLRFFLSKAKAREFYISELKWSADQFDAVDWDSLHLTLQQKRQMYSLWLAKQATKFCGTRIQVARMTDGADDRCPNCLAPQERAIHLNLCPSSLRTQQFEESVRELSLWLQKDHTHPEIAFWLPRYLLARSRCSFVDLPNFGPVGLGLSMSSQMKAIAQGQDKIGWHHLLEGKITGHFKGMQQLYLRGSSQRINGQDWTKQLISRLIKISHTQWIVRNLTLHDQKRGHLAKLRRAELAEELERLHSMDPSEVPEESKFLLDFDIDDLAEGDIANQEHWIIAMRAARVAGMRRQSRSIRWAASPRRRRKHRAPPSRVFISTTV